MRSILVAGSEKGIGLGRDVLSWRHILVALSRQCKDLVKLVLFAVDSAFPGRAGHPVEPKCLLPFCVFMNQFSVLQGEEINSKLHSEQVTHALYDSTYVIEWWSVLVKQSTTSNLN